MSCPAPQVRGNKRCLKGVKRLVSEDVIDEGRDEAIPHMVKLKGTGLAPNRRFIHLFVVGISKTSK